MAALLVMPAVAFAVLVTILYEDRLLPQSGSAPEPLADGEPAVGTAPAAAAVAATEETAAVPAIVTDPEPAGAERVGAESADAGPVSVPAVRPRDRRCEVGRDTLPPARPRVHRPLVGAAAGPATVPPPSTSGVRLKGAVSLPRR